MKDQRFIGIIKSSSAKLRTVTGPDGSKYKQGVYNIKLESADIDYKEMAKFNSNISATLLNIQPIPFKSIDFGEQSISNLMVSLCLEEDDEGQHDPSKSVEAEFGNVVMKKIRAIINSNIPTYIFELEMPIEGDGKFLFKNLKKKISFEFSDFQKLIK